MSPSSYKWMGVVGIR